jgi:tRNA-2-methylthio-N6-dimethylallyladenosine synthase
MNFADSEVIASLLLQEGYGPTPQPDNAHLILINTCSIRDKAEQTSSDCSSGSETKKSGCPGGYTGLYGRKT